MDKSAIAGTGLFILVVVNIIWYSAKLFIHRNGLRVSMLRHTRDFYSLRRLMSDEYSNNINLIAKMYLYGIPVIAFVAFVLFYSLVGNDV